MNEFLEMLFRASSLGSQALAGACESLLGQMRPMDEAGAKAIVTGDTALCRAIAANDPRAAFTRLAQLASARACIRCGTCCRNSSPTLREPDLPLLGPEGPGLKNFYTLRAGERVFSHRRGESLVLEAEIIKPREGGGGCVFLRHNACTIYERRPLECRLQRCWEPFVPSKAPALTRAQILGSDPTALAIAREYDIKLPASELDKVFQAAARGEQQALARARELIALDERLRMGIEEKYGYGPDEQLLILGRPAREIARSYSLAVVVLPAKE